ncbi:MAG: hypothetical protein IJD75_03015 [Clostridia bacterium]|nr:hypothetical protein [Clostridia bacterium]
MASDKMKLDYNNLMRLIVEMLNTVVSEDPETVFLAVKDNAFGISIGLELLTSYLKDIALLAIKRNDAELLELCKGLLIVEETEDKK